MLLLGTCWEMDGRVISAAVRAVSVFTSADLSGRSVVALKEFVSKSGGVFSWELDISTVAVETSKSMIVLVDGEPLGLMWTSAVEITGEIRSMDELTLGVPSEMVVIGVVSCIVDTA